MRLLGEGASAVVLEAIDLETGRKVALKVYQHGTAASEFDHLSRLSHPNIVPILDVACLEQSLTVDGMALESGAPFIALAYLEGEEPGQHVLGATGSERGTRIKRVMRGLAEALLYLHRNGLKHYDLKPENCIVVGGGDCVLIDLGLAGIGQARDARGTPAFMAPEMLAGIGADHRADLYSLGATCFAIAASAPPFADLQGPKLYRAILERPPTFTPCRWLEPQLRELLGWLLEKDPAARPASAQTVVAELARIDGDQQRVVELTSQPVVTAPAFVGRSEQLAVLAGLLHRSSSAGIQCVELVGPPGVGKTRLVDEAVARHQRRAAAGEHPAVSHLRGLGGLGKQAVSADDRAMAALEDLEARCRHRPVVLSLAEEPDTGLDPAALRLWEILGRSREDRLALVVIVERDAAEASAVGAGERLELGPLNVRETGALVRSMTGVRPEPADARRIQQLSSGIPLLVVELAAQWASSPSALDVDLGLDADLGLEADGDRPGLEALVRSRRRALEANERELVDAIAVWGLPLRAGSLEALVRRRVAEEGLEQLAAVGLLVREADRFDLPSTAHRRAWLATAGTTELQRLRIAALGILERELEDPALRGQRSPLLLRRANLLLDAGRPRATKIVLATAAELAGPCPQEALALIGRLGEAARKQSAARRLRAELLIQAGRYAEALEALEGASADPELLLRARALQLGGDYPAARVLLEELTARQRPRSDARREADGLLGRVLLRQGEVRRAREVSAAAEEMVEVEAAECSPLDPAKAALIEVAGLSRLYLNQVGEAAGYFAWGARALVRGGAALQARFANLRGMVAFVEGALEEAAGHYEHALELSRSVGDAHGTATYTGCVGSTLVELGRYGSALQRLSAAARALERLGRAGELVAALCNLGNLMLALGDLREVERLLRRARELQAELGAGPWGGALERLAGDLARRRGDDAEHARCYLAAADLQGRAGDEQQRRATLAALAGARARLGEVDHAAELLGPLGPATEDPAVAVGWALVVSEARRRRREEPAGVPPELAEWLASHCAALESRGAKSDLWRAALALGELLDSRGAPGARAALARARQTWEEIMSQSPELYRPKMERDAEARRLEERWGALADRGAERPERQVDLGAHQRLRRLLKINSRLNAEVLDLDRLLEMVVDTVIELTDAERGFLLLVEPGAADQASGELEIRVARNIEQGRLSGEQLAVSRSIAEQATRSGEPVVTIDAADDGRFSAALSVCNLRLRSVLAVPLSVRGRVVGAIYVDHRLRRGVFGDEEVELILDFADQAAIAIDTARLLADDRRRQQEIEDLNRQLASTVEDQRAELDEAQEELRSSREALKTRYDYSEIIGASGRMRELFRLIDRVTDTELPVVIQGASGTGKELVARAIHHNGRRANRAFVGENCGAIPESLLEGVLFGHVRGAFTGADRDRKGLFEIADGGTLFLDEVGEMSPAMQTKLLRVLQGGELRRVGGERTICTDVRLIAASNADLRQLVEQGRFREDLYYRLNVVRIEVPLLRERREDIALLVDHFVAKYGQPPQRLDAAAMKQLCGYAWPGNVRELENEVMRIVALGGPVIGVDDLSPQVRQSAPLSPRDPDDLTIRPRVASLERELIQRALGQTGGNQSRAARLLGLSRYGLLKKLKRHFGEDPEDRPAALRPRARAARR